jgi:hypothetical protein
MAKLCGIVCRRITHMSRIHWDLQVLFRQKCPYAQWIHFVIRRRTLSSNYLDQELEKILQTAVKVNCVKIRPLKARMLARLYEENSADLFNFLLWMRMAVSGIYFNTSVRSSVWVLLKFSRGKSWRASRIQRKWFDLETGMFKWSIWEASHC